MTTTDALTDVLTGHLVQWTGAVTYTTRKGKSKPVLVGLPGKAFWLHYKSQDGALKCSLRLSGAWLNRLSRGSWEVLVPLRPQLVGVISQATGIDPLALMPDEVEASVPSDVEAAEAFPVELANDGGPF